MNTTKFENERSNYPVLSKYAYLDTPTTGLIPSYAADAMCEFIQGRCANGADLRTYDAGWTRYDTLRSDIGTMIGCKGSEITFGLNSSSLFNIFSNGIGLEPGDNVVTYKSAYPAMTYLWINKRQGGVEVRFAEDKDGYLPPEELFKLVDKKTKALTVCCVDYFTGFKHDLKTIGTFCREHGIYFGVDATQACGVLPLDVGDMKIDFLTSSGYKWLQCVLGIGFAYIRRELLDVIIQKDMGWAGTKNRQRNDAMLIDLSENANRFEHGGLNFTAAVGLKKVVDSYLRLGREDIGEYVLSLTNHVYERVSHIKNISIFGDYPKLNRSQIVCLKFPPEWPVTSDSFTDFGIRARVIGSGLTRIGVHYYNNVEDVDKYLDYLESFNR